MRRSAVYKALLQLEARNLIAAHEGPGSGPARKIYRITDDGLAELRREGLGKLAEPSHPRNELDLAIYALPFLPRGEATVALTHCQQHLRHREAFIAERLAWCEERGLVMPALAFERPLLALRAELAWLDRVAREYEADPTDWAGDPTDWAGYAFDDPTAPEH